MSENQAAPQAPAATQTPPDAKATQPQGASTPGTPGGQAGGNPVSEAAKEAARKLRIKNDDGTEEEIDEDEVVKTYRERKKHQAVASRELNEGRAEKKRAEEFISMMKDKGKVFEVLQKLGHDPRKLTEEFLAEKIKYEMLPEHERKLMEKDEQLKVYQEKERLAEEAKNKEHNDKLTKHYVEKFNKEIVEALTDTPIPQNKDSVAKMAEYIAKYAKAKIQISAKEAALLVKQDLEETQARIYKSATPEQLLALLGEEGLQKLRAYDVSKLKSPEKHLQTPPDQPDAGTRKRSSDGRYTPSEWRLHKRGLL